MDTLAILPAIPLVVWGVGAAASALGITWFAKEAVADTGEAAEKIADASGKLLVVAAVGYIAWLKFKKK